jgi:hypothetical protein
LSRNRRPNSTDADIKNAAGMSGDIIAEEETCAPIPAMAIAEIKLDHLYLKRLLLIK